MYDDDSFHSSPLYFGDDNQQTTIIEKLEKAAMQYKTGLQLVAGGPSCGKSSALEHVRDGLEQSRRFTVVAEAGQVEAGFVPSDVPQDLAQLLRDMNEGHGIYVQHQVYKANDKKKGRDQYVVVAEGETPLTDNKALRLLHRAGMLATDKKKPYDLLWIADVPVRLQGVSLFKPASSARYESDRHHQVQRQLEQEFGKEMVVHEVKYHPATARDAIWDAVQDKGKTFLDSFSRTTHRPHDEADAPHWEKARAAALAGNRKDYDSAMRVLMQNARTPRSKVD